MPSWADDGDVEHLDFQLENVLAPGSPLLRPGMHVHDCGDAVDVYVTERTPLHGGVVCSIGRTAGAAAIGTAMIAGMHVQPWFDFAGILERGVVARVAEEMLGIDPEFVLGIARPEGPMEDDSNEYQDRYLRKHSAVTGEIDA